MRRMLIVDDEPKICEFLKRFFERSGFNVETSTSPLEALERVKSARPDLLLLDVRMSPLSGLEVLKQVKALDPEIRVVMVSAVADEQIVREALRLGALDYVTKPLELDTRWWAERFFGFPPLPS